MMKPLFLAVAVVLMAGPSQAQSRSRASRTAVRPPSRPSAPATCFFNAPYFQSPYFSGDIPDTQPPAGSQPVYDPPFIAYGDPAPEIVPTFTPVYVDLGALSRLEAERRSAIHETVRTYTNADLAK